MHSLGAMELSADRGNGSSLTCLRHLSSVTRCGVLGTCFLRLFKHMPNVLASLPTARLVMFAHSLDLSLLMVAFIEFEPCP